MTDSFNRMVGSAAQLDTRDVRLQRRAGALSAKPNPERSASIHVKCASLKTVCNTGIEVRAARRPGEQRPFWLAALRTPLFRVGCELRFRQEIKFLTALV